MKKRLLALSVATALTMGAGVSNAFEVADNGIGLYNLMPYYTAQAGSATLIQVTNTDTENGKAVKVRFRGAEWSDDVFDFTLFLSPGDVWTGSVSANGLIAAMRTVDNSCTLPASIDQDFVTSRLEASDSAAAGTREGYVEVITMADIPKPLGYDDLPLEDQVLTLYGAIKHVDGVAPCTFSVLSGLQQDQGAGLDPNGLDVPTGSLMSYAINIQVSTSKAFANEAVALNPGDDPNGATNKIFFRQANETLTASAALTADRIFGAVGTQLGTGLQMFQFDMPDLTTPIAGAADAFAQRDEVTDALRRATATIEYVTDDAILATTDVVFNQPTRRFYYTYTVACQLDDSCDYDINGNDVNIEGETGSIYQDMDGTNNLIGVGDPDFWDREENQFSDPSDIVISPTPPTEIVPFFLKGEVSVVSINNGELPTGSLGATLTAFNYDSPLEGQDGWVELSTTAVTGGDSDLRLPVIGFTAIKLFNGGVGAAGTNYGLALPLRTPEIPSTP